MKYLLVVTLVFYVNFVLCAPQYGNQYNNVEVQRYENELTPDNGGYKFVLVFCKYLIFIFPNFFI